MPEKPVLTREQRWAIEGTGATLIVSSAAGSGKTKVLVERFLYLVTEAPAPTDVDRILAVTFTDAAAAQLKSRIGQALREKWEATGEERLARQILLLDKAEVSTFHSFCHRVVRRNFHRVRRDSRSLGPDPGPGADGRGGSQEPEMLDPAFVVMDDGEGEILRREVLDEVFESEHARGDALFRDLLLRYGGRDLDQTLKEIVLKIHAYLQTIPGQTWTEGEAGEERWRKAFRALLRSRIEKLLESCARARSRIPAGEVGVPYREFLGRQEAAAQGWLETLDGEDTASALAAIREFEAGKCPDIPQKNTSWGKALRGAVDKVNDAAEKLEEDAGRWEEADLLDEIEAARPRAAGILDLVSRFDEAYTQAKVDRAIVDFNDLERYCLALLEDDESGVARALRDGFDHVLVDEYQDTNPIQERILTLVARPVAAGANLFTVGDIKQSIYRFRLAEPRVFQERYDRSSPALDAADRRIDLSANFRSRRGVIEAVNAVFGKLMRGGDSEILYDDAARLTYGAHYPTPASGLTAREVLPVELHLLPRRIELGEEEDGTDAAEAGSAGREALAETESAEREAMFVAHRIRALLTEGLEVWEPDREAFHPLAYRDVAILLRSRKNKVGIYARVLREAGVPVYTEPAAGYLTATEIQDMVSLLRVIDNPLQDIPVAAVLRSPLVGLTDEDLVRVRLGDRGAEFCRAVLTYGESGEEEGLRTKICSFLERVEGWRTQARRGPLADLVGDIYARTEYPAYVRGLENGLQRQVNLIRLHERARQFDQFRTQGLRRFLAFLDRLLDTEGDLGQPPAASEGEDAVRVMTIHKSKGLEFPVVFVPDLGKQFNLQDLKGDVLFDRDLGIGCAAVDPVRRYRYPSAAMSVIRDRIRSRNLAEELRILYVAMTRAREHLILSGTADEETDPARWAAAAARNPFAGARTPLDWMGPVIASDPSGLEALRAGGPGGEVGPFMVRVHTSAELAGWAPADSDLEAKDPTLESLARLEPIGAAREGAEVLVDRFRWTYPHAAATTLPGKESVTKMARRLDPWTGDFEEDRRRIEKAFETEPAFACETGGRLTPEERGTAFHTLFEHVDLARAATRDEVRAQVEFMAERRLLSPAQKEALLDENADGKVVDFFRSDLGRRMLASGGSLRREMPFTARLPAVDSCEDTGACEKDFIVVQGVIDALFEEDGGYVLVDYKSDRITRDQVPARAKAYEGQMAHYARAVATILGKPVREAVLAFVEPGKAWPVPVGAPD